MKACIKCGKTYGHWKLLDVEDWQGCELIYCKKCAKQLIKKKREGAQYGLVLTPRGWRKLARALDDIKHGRVHTWEQVKKELDKRRRGDKNEKK